MTIDEVKNALDLKKALGLEEIINLTEKEYIVRHNWGCDMYTVSTRKSFDSESYWYTLEELKEVLELYECFPKMTSSTPSN